MKHKYIVDPGKREYVMGLIAAIEGLSSKTDVQVEDAIIVTTADERLAGFFDYILKPVARIATDPIHANQAHAAKVCKDCHEEFIPKDGRQRLCPACSQKRKNPFFVSNSKKAEWTVLGSGEEITHNELTRRLGERIIDVGEQLSHVNNGIYSVAMSKDKLTLRKIIE